MLFSKNIPKQEYKSHVRVKRRERGIWQRQYWEHLITDEKDYRHMNYARVNPVKHGLVRRVKD